MSLLLLSFLYLNCVSHDYQGWITWITNLDSNNGCRNQDHNFTRCTGIILKFFSFFKLGGLVKCQLTPFLLRGERRITNLDFSTPHPQNSPSLVCLSVSFWTLLRLTSPRLSTSETQWKDESIRILTRKSSLCLWCPVIKGCFSGFSTLIKRSWSCILRFWLVAVGFRSSACRLNLMEALMKAIPPCCWLTTDHGASWCCRGNEANLWVSREISRGVTEAFTLAFVCSVNARVAIIAWKGHFRFQPAEVTKILLYFRYFLFKKKIRFI